MKSLSSFEHVHVVRNRSFFFPSFFAIVGGRALRIVIMKQDMVRKNNIHTPPAQP